MECVEKTMKECSDMACAENVPMATLQDETLMAMGVSHEILARAKAINSFLFGVRDCDEADNRSPQCCQDEIAETNRVLQGALRELREIQCRIGME